MRIALFDFRQTVDYRLEILSGLTVAMATENALRKAPPTF